MAHAVRVQTLARECRDVGAGTVKCLARMYRTPNRVKGVPRWFRNTLASERKSISVLHTMSVTPELSAATVGNIVLSAFAEQSELIRPCQLQIVRPEIDHLLHAGPGIEHSRQESIIPAAICS